MAKFVSFLLPHPSSISITNQENPRFSNIHVSNSSSISITNKTNPRLSNIHASNFDSYPLASRLIIRNLPFKTSQSRLVSAFSDFGQIAEVKLPKDDKNKSKGYALIQYTSQEEALLALECMDHTLFEDRVLHVEIAKPRRNYDGYPITQGPPQEQPTTEE